MKPLAFLVVFLIVVGTLVAVGAFLVCCAIVASERKRRRRELPPIWEEAAVIWRGSVAQAWQWARCNVGRHPRPASADRGPEVLQVADASPAARQKACPVCGTEQPGDSPEGLCPQCLFQCALSDSDHGLVEGEHDTTGHPGLPPVPTPAELAPHFPQLEILEFVGQGGMGAVYKARQLKLDRLVAVKILPQEWGKDPAFAERFAREARAMARLSHPQIVGVHDFGEAGGYFYLVMEFVDGVNVRQLLRPGQLQPRQALAMVAQVCDALEYAHQEGIVHRDIKPENILLDKRGRAKIADFGLAKLVRRSGADLLTGSRQIMGTVDYMAPEQRISPQSVDHRADIYALGVVLYEMLTGELPLGRFAPPSERAGVDARLDQVVFRALEREPGRRYQRVSALKADVDSVLAQRPVAHQPPADAEPSPPARHAPRRFLYSMLSVFVSRTAAAKWLPAPKLAAPGVEQPLAVQVRLQPQPPVRKRRLLGVKVLVVGVVLSAGLTVIVTALSRQAAYRSYSMERPAPAILFAGDFRDLQSTLHLRSNQVETLQRIFSNADQEYLDMEVQHTTRRFGPTGTAMITIGPFPDEVSQLEGRVWAKINAILEPDQYVQALAQLRSSGSLFPYGKTATRIEIWRAGTGYQWKIEVEGDAKAPIEGGGRQLPRGFERFWQNGTP